MKKVPRFKLRHDGAQHSELRNENFMYDERTNCWTWGEGMEAVKVIRLQVVWDRDSSGRREVSSFNIMSNANGIDATQL